jgi:hypothetical protein
MVSLWGQVHSSYIVSLWGQVHSSYMVSLWGQAHSSYMVSLWGEVYISYMVSLWVQVHSSYMVSLWGEVYSSYMVISNANLCDVLTVCCTPIVKIQCSAERKFIAFFGTKLHGSSHGLTPLKFVKY